MARWLYLRRSGQGSGASLPRIRDCFMTPTRRPRGETYQAVVLFGFETTLQVYATTEQFEGQLVGPLEEARHGQL